MLGNPPMMQEDDILREPAGLTDIVGDHDDLDAAVLRGDQETLDGERRGGIEARGGLVEEQDIGL